MFQCFVSFNCIPVERYETVSYISGFSRYNLGDCFVFSCEGMSTFKSGQSQLEHTEFEGKK